jgi:hypothetical protein
MRVKCISMVSRRQNCLADRSHTPILPSARSAPPRNPPASCCARLPACNARIAPCSYLFRDGNWFPPTSRQLQHSPELHVLLRSQKDSVQIDYRAAAGTARALLELLPIVVLYWPTYPTRRGEEFQPWLDSDYVRPGNHWQSSCRSFLRFRRRTEAVQGYKAASPSFSAPGDPNQKIQWMRMGNS